MLPGTLPDCYTDAEGEITMSGIVADGAKRLRKTIEAEVRREFATELAKVPNFWGRRTVQKKIDE